jgi:hypothetical protein
VPAAIAVSDLEATIAQAVNTHRPELERYVREQVQRVLDELIREQVDAESGCA